MAHLRRRNIGTSLKGYVPTCSGLERPGTLRQIFRHVPACSDADWLSAVADADKAGLSADWDEHGRDERYLLPAGVQIERGRALLNNPGDVAVDDICDYVGLSIEKEDERFATERRLADLPRSGQSHKEVLRARERSARSG
jgi:hypothetical protein